MEYAKSFEIRSSINKMISSMYSVHFGVKVGFGIFKEL